jgi:hypothetical protein
MSFSENGASNMIMPVGPMANGYGNGTGGFGWGDGSFWIIVLFLFALMGNWGGNGWGNGAGSNGGMVPMFMNTNNDLQHGFDQQAVMSGITGINGAVVNGFAGVNQALCNGFAGVTAGMNAGFSAAEASANARQMADMQQNFANQTAVTAGITGLSQGLNNCCCENRAAVADLKYTVATEACSDRAAVTAALQEVTAQNNANTQRILDQMCQDKIDAKNEKIAELQNQLTMANLAASQNAQTAQILTDNLAQTNALEQFLAPVPKPAYIVQNPNGCGCGWNGQGCCA